MVVTQKILVENSLIEAITFNKKGDQCTFKTQSVVLGSSGILGLTVLGEVSGLKIEFRATVDSVNWSDWSLLTLENLQNLSLRERHPFQIEYKVTCLQDDYNYILSIDLELEMEKFPTPTSYKEFPLSQFSPFLNMGSLLWSVNVLQKFYKKGIVPEFIKRGTNENWEDLDYLDLWWSLVYPNSLKVEYNKVYKELLYRKDLLKDFLNQKGLVSGKSEDLGVLYYLALFFFNEVRRRGTWSLFEQELVLPESFEGIEVPGELIRLLDSDKIEKLIFSGDELGWFIGESSPLYLSGENTLTSVLGYEYSSNLENLEVYPLINSQYVQKSTLGSVSGFLLSPPSGQFCGIGFSETLVNKEDYFLKVNPKFSYEITFLFRGGLGQTLEVGVDTFNSSGDSLGDCQLVNNLNLESSFFFKKKLHLSNSFGEFSFVRCILWSFGQPQVNSFDSQLFGQNLKFRREDVEFIIPKVRVIGGGSSPVQLYDFKVRPCILGLSEFLSQENLLVLRAENLSELSDSEVRRFIDTKLIPYNMELVFQTSEVL